MDNETLQYILNYIDTKFDKLLKHVGENTSLPIASKFGFGGIVVGDRLTINADTGKLSADTQTPSTVTANSNGLMIFSDKVKLDSIKDTSVVGSAEADVMFNAIFDNYTYNGGGS